MKLYLRNLLIVISLFGLIQCNSTPQNNDAMIKFEKIEYNFGELEQNSEASCFFTYTNSGETPLIIQNVKTSCGCTVPQWTTEPVKPGKSGEIEIDYDTSHPGVFKKNISIFYNGANSPLTLTIKGSVNYPK